MLHRLIIKSLTLVKWVLRFIVKLFYLIPHPKTCVTQTHKANIRMYMYMRMYIKTFSHAFF